MSIDFSQLLAGEGGQDISDALAATSASGDVLFKRPFGDSTHWVTKTGKVKVTVLFDPFLPWTRSNLMASTNGDYMGDIKLELGRYLCPDKMSRTKPNHDEIKWEKIRAHLSDRAFSHYLMKENRLEDYVEIIKGNVEEQLVEDEAMIQAIAEKQFRFTYHLAVDAYPQEKNSKLKALSGQATANERYGVLVFHIEGCPKESKDETDKVKKIGIDGQEEVDEDGNKRDSFTRMASEEIKPSLNRHQQASTNKKKNKEELDQLLERLNISADKLEEGENVYLKKLPETTMEFFDQMGSWFNTLIVKKQGQLSEESNAEGAGMYR